LEKNTTKRIVSSSEQKRAISYSVSSTILLSILRLAVVAILSRTLGPKDVGISIAVSIYVLVFETIFVIGFGPNIVQRTSLTNETLATVFCANLISAAIGFVLSIVTSVRADQLLGIDGCGTLIRIASVTIIIKSLGSSSLFIIQRQYQFKFLGLLETSAAVIANTFVCIPLAFIYPSPLVPIISTILEATIISIVGLVKYPPRNLALASFSETRNILQYSFGLHLVRSLNGLARSCDKWLIGRLMGAESLGLYSRASQVVSSCETVFASAFGRIIFSEMSRIQNNQDLIAKTVSTILTKIFRVSFLLTSWVWIFIDNLVEQVLGPDWTSIATTSKIFSIAIGFKLGSNALTHAARSNANITPLVKSNTIGIILSLVMISGACQFGLNFVAISSVGAAITQYILISKAFATIAGISINSFYQTIKVATKSSLVFIFMAAGLKIAIQKAVNPNASILILAFASAMFICAIEYRRFTAGQSAGQKLTKVA